MTDIVRPGQAAVLLNAEAMPANVDLAIYRGDYIDIEVELTDNEDAPIPLTDLIPEAQLRTAYDAPSGIAFECTVVDGPGGKVRIYMSSAATAALAEDAYIWDFQLKNIDDDARTYFTGDVTVSPEVTKP